MRGAANADFSAGVEQKQGMSGSESDVAAAGDHSWPGVCFDSRRSFGCHFEVIAFNSTEGGGEILR
jgi:hypothetical protein